jgi:hypothetical protein
MDQKNLQGIEVAAIIGLGAIASGFIVILSRRVRALVERLFDWKWLAPFAPIYSRLSVALNAYRHSYVALLLAFCTSLLTLVLTNSTPSSPLCYWSPSR